MAVWRIKDRPFTQAVEFQMLDSWLHNVWFKELLGAISSARPPRHMKTPSFYTTPICLSFMPTQLCACVLSFSTGIEQTQCDHRNYWEAPRIRNLEWNSFKLELQQIGVFFLMGQQSNKSAFSKSPDTKWGYKITICEIHSGLNESICHLVSISCAFLPLSLC